ncbi:Cytochrome P450 84A1 [Dichanthelium oligosanthes]|uniref:Cytochrome P450 84A1 n=1 Tax=Dichanthelium oligosanthes TaxID=888268 RepID=A0A1E5W5V5_9POAL|nr:Cytochrome P450 84A1 [Dichanthelium oligosanthes]
MFFVWYSGRRRRASSRFPPGPPCLPAIDNLLAMEQFTHRGLAKLAKLHGGFFHLRIGFANVFIVSSPETAREILHQQDSLFTHRPVTTAMTYVSYDLADMAFAHYGPFWRHMRKLCVMKLFSRGRDLSWRAVRTEVDDLIKSLAEQKGTVANVGELVFMLSTNMTLRAAFGARSQEDEEEFVAIIRELSEIFLAFNVADFIPFVGWLDLNGINKRMKAGRRALDVFIDRIIDEHIAKWKNGNVSAADMVDDMIAYLAEAPGTDTREDGVELKDLRLTRDNIKCLIMDIMFGGTETAASTLEWVMLELLRSPGELKRAQRELASVVGLHRKVDERDLEKLPYLRFICKEVLRLHPPIPLLLRESLQDCTVSGHAIPRKSRVWINVWAMGHDEKHWPDAEAFRPSSRFAVESADVDFRGGDFRYLPFGSGRRSCPGIQLGMYALELGLAHFLHCFDWSPPDGMTPSELDVDDVFGLTAPKAVRLTAVPWPRLSCPLF